MNLMLDLCSFKFYILNFFRFNQIKIEIVHFVQLFNIQQTARKKKFKEKIKKKSAM